MVVFPLSPGIGPRCCYHPSRGAHRFHTDHVSADNFFVLRMKERGSSSPDFFMYSAILNFFCVGFLHTVRYKQAGGRFCKLLWRLLNYLPYTKSYTSACKMCGRYALVNGFWSMRLGLFTPVDAIAASTKLTKADAGRLIASLPK